LRRFIRHPADIPIVISRSDRPSYARLQSRNVSHGGLAFASDMDVEPGATVELHIPVVRPSFHTTARVVWCSERPAGYEIGVEFLDADDAFRARMVEQVCHIETYKNEIYRAEGRILSSEEAAMEWISRYAGDFPNPDAGSAG